MLKATKTNLQRYFGDTDWTEFVDQMRDIEEDASVTGNREKASRLLEKISPLIDGIGVDVINDWGYSSKSDIFHIKRGGYQTKTILYWEDAFWINHVDDILETYGYHGN